MPIRDVNDAPVPTPAAPLCAALSPVPHAPGPLARASSQCSWCSSVSRRASRASVLVVIAGLRQLARFENGFGQLLDKQRHAVGSGENLLVNRHAKGTPYRRAKGTPFVAICMKTRCFYVRLKGPFLCPGLITPRRRAQPRSSMAEGHRGAARGVLDGGEHGASLEQGWVTDQPDSASASSHRRSRRNRRCKRFWFAGLLNPGRSRAGARSPEAR
jgi:hypothetical protein